jgi:protein O-GlcNAc transferase
MAKTTLQQAFELALKHHQNGRLSEAEELYLQILAAQPTHPETLHFLGILSFQRGQNQAALAYFDQALKVRPDWPDALSNRGEALRVVGRLDEAVAAYQRAIALNPRFPQAFNNLGNALVALGHHNKALAAYQKAIGFMPGYAEAQNNIGGVLKKLGRLDESAAAYLRAISLRPGNFQALTNLGTVLKENGQLDRAIDILQQAIALKPDYPEAHYNLGNALKEKGLLEEAVAAYRQVTVLKLGVEPASYPQAESSEKCGRSDELLVAFRQAMLALRPDSAEAHGHLLLAMLHQHGDDRAIAEEHFLWQRQHAGPASEWMLPPSTDERSSERLRIGYVSPDFREHSVTRFLLPLMENHDREKFEIFAYSEVPAPDEITSRLQSLTDVWRDTVGLGDAQVTKLIREDGIDILVDLAGHTAGNRLLVFARRPAPMQVSWLGYPSTTGLDAMTHRLTDAHVDPPGMTEKLHSESLVRLPHSAWCFSATDFPKVPPRPERGVVFGCFNNFAKVTDSMLQVWAQILAAVPDSSLLLKSPAFAEKVTCKRVNGLFQTQGIAPDRILLRDRTRSQAEHLALYQEMDIALDTYPYHGTTTTCEALWMGVPVVTLEGTSHRSRVGVSLLRNVGLPQLIANSPEEYVRVATVLAGDIQELELMRDTLRERMLASPLMDARRFARDIESAYQTIWKSKSTDGPLRT